MFSPDMRFHQSKTKMLQEKPPFSQFSGVPVLVYFAPYYKGTHINDIEENDEGPAVMHQL